MGDSTRFLLFLFGDVGDTLLSVPAIRALRNRYPNSSFAVVCKPQPAHILTTLGLVERVIVTDKHLFDRPAALLSPRAWLVLAATVRRLRQERADVVVILHHLVTRWGAAKFALLSMGSGARERVGIDNGRGWFLTRSVRDRGFGAMHEAEYFLAVANLLDGRGPLVLEAPVTEGDRNAARRLLYEIGLDGRRFFAVHPGTGPYGPGRLWNPRGFAEAARSLGQSEDMECVVVGTREEASAIREVCWYTGPKAHNLEARTSLGVLGGILERAEVLLANDGGVAHLAAAVGTPVVAVFGPSNDRAWRPLLGTVVAADLPCRPCFYRDFERGKPGGCSPRECMHLVTPAMVVAAARRLLRERRGAA